MFEAQDSIRVLHVDDEPDFADLTATFLEREEQRFSVQTATSASEGLERLSETDFDCIVSDYDMPGKSGIEFLRTVRASEPEIPFLLFTGKGSEEIASEAIRAGATDYLQKGGSSDQYELLANRIRNAVAQHQSERTQQWLRELAENTDRVLYSFTADWEELLFVNTAYEDIWGRSVADFHDDPTDFMNGVHPDDREGVRKAMESVTRKETVDIEYRVNAEEEYGRWVRSHAEPIIDESGDVVRIAGFAAEITEDRRRRERHERQRETLLELTTDEAVTSGDFDTAVRRVTQTAADILDVDRVNVWIADDTSENAFTCVDNYDRRTGDHTDGMQLFADDYPTYFRALENNPAIDADDAHGDSRTADLADGYLDEHGISALLDSALRVEGDVVGVICHEHVGGDREWTDDEIDFASDIADIVGRALRNQERRERKQELELKTRAVEEAPVGISITGPKEADNPLIYVNERFEELTGYDESEILGRNCRFLQGEGTEQEPLDRMREAIEAEEPLSVVVKNYRKDGTEFWNRVSVAPVTVDDDGTVTNYVGFQEDVSERVERETTLEALHAAAAEIQACNSVEAACERTVTAAETVLDFEMCSLMIHDGDYLDPVALSSGAPPDGARRMEDDEGLAGKTFQTGESYVVEEVTPDDDTDPAKEFYRSGMSVPIGDYGVFQAVSNERSAFDEADRTFTELLLAHTARTIDRLDFEDEIRERREALERRNERLQRFAGLVSHDVRNPLNVAMGELELAREEHDSGHLDSVARAHDRIDGLLEHLLTLAREGAPVEKFETVDLDVIANRCWDNVATAESTLRVDSDLSIRAEPERLQRLFENLIRNSVEHTDSGVTVTVGDFEDGFYVADDGPGIPPDERADVFEYGYSSTSSGTGFGLAIVQEIADAHDWTVSITESESGGARFEFTGVEQA